MEKISKTQINLEEYAKMIEKGSVSKDMLLGAWSVLDKDVSKYAYLKKKFANASVGMNDGNICGFNISIQKRNLVERILKQKYGLSRENIETLVAELPAEKLIYRKYVDRIYSILKEIYV